MIAGITGHQDLGSEATVEWLSSALATIVGEYKIDEGITSLAIGADQLYAKILRERHIPYTAIIPSGGYETTFQNTDDFDRYHELLRNASATLQLPFEKPSEAAFYEAGKRTVQLSDMMIAIWNGRPAKGLGGTGDVVKYAL